MGQFIIGDVLVGRLNALVRAIGGIKNMEGILDGSKRVTVEDIPLIKSRGHATIAPTTSGNAVRLLLGKEFRFQFMSQTAMLKFLLEELQQREPAPIPKTILSYIDLQRLPVGNEFKFGWLWDGTFLLRNFVFESGTLFSLLFNMLSLQTNGEEGNLATQGRDVGNVFYAWHRQTATHPDTAKSARYPISIYLHWHLEPFPLWELWVDKEFNNPCYRYMRPGNRIFIPGDQSAFAQIER